MGIKLLIGNTHLKIEGASLKILRTIDRLCAYRIAGYLFSPSYKSHRWDGREHLFKFTKRDGYRAPAGLTTDIIDLLKKKQISFKISYETKLKHSRVELKWNPKIKLRDYQKEAVAGMLSKPFPGRGVLKMPIRSGKTRTSAKIIYKIGRPTLFVVPSKWLLYQTIESLKECFIDADIGQIGDGVYKPGFITVATVQTLSQMAPVRRTKKKPGRIAHPKYQSLISNFDLVITDESHHFRGKNEWCKVFVDIDARFKIGLSATVFFDNESEQEAGIIWLKGACGPIKHEVPASRLIKEGYLLPQRVKIYKIEKPEIPEGSRYSATLKKRCITENKYRNEIIAHIVKEHIPSKTIIIANEHAHINSICKELSNLNIKHKTLTGRDSQDRRDSVVRDFLDDQFHVIVGNVLGEGVDIPAVECVVNAEGGKDEKKTWQRQRNLTIVEGSKKAPILIDFLDSTSNYFRKHSEARISIYSGEQEFTVEYVKCP